VQKLLTPDEFASRMVGVPWRRWRSDFEACDCYGMCVLYYRAVLGIDPGDVPQTDIATGFAAARGWIECPRTAGASCFMSWRNGAPTHCGVLIGRDHVLHAQEGYPVSETGSVRLTRLAVMQRTCRDLRFYRYEAPTC
jgi:cell wall-associated NlpC family hydrolase